MTGVATKLCHIVKRPDFEGYGFNLHSENKKPGQYIGKVDSSSPAEEAGLKEGDRIIEVNGVAIHSETHKQVVQRIKAITCEVRLLLLDVESKEDVNPVTAVNNSATTTANGNSSSNDAKEFAAVGTLQELPGASANISSISMISTKRMSETSDHSNNNGSNSSQQRVQNTFEIDTTDNAINIAGAPDAGIGHKFGAEDIKNKSDSSGQVSAVPAPPSVAIATAPHQTSNNNATLTTKSNSTDNTANTMDATSAVVNKPGSLHLPTTAAEMRAKLFSKKKYDPKNESVDLKKKFDIIQKL